MIKAVLDTNVVVSGKLAPGTRSPNKEILSRWIGQEYDLLYSDDVLKEYAEKLLELGAAAQVVERFIFEVMTFAHHVSIGFYHTRHYPVDSDDTMFLLAALNGRATHLVTYDEHLETVGVFYPEFKTCRPLDFLSELRLQQP
jgi:putative PIN family toxin of toxin-antitoxin system